MHLYSKLKITNTVSLFCGGWPAQYWGKNNNYWF
jgi:hypothetical protein